MMKKRFLSLAIAFVMFSAIILSNIIVFAESDNGIKILSISGSHSAVIKNDGSLWMWGNNSAGQLGDGTTTNSTTPIKIMDDVKFVSLGILYADFTKEGFVLNLNNGGYKK